MTLLLHKKRHEHRWVEEPWGTQNKHMAKVSCGDLESMPNVPSESGPYAAVVCLKRLNSLDIRVYSMERACVYFSDGQACLL